MPETMGAGCAFLDFDNDGNLDILLVNGKSWSDGKSNQTPKLYRNLGDGRFSDVTRAAKLNVSMYGMGVAIADYDNDGDADLYFTNLGPNRLFQNNGDGTFTDVTEIAKVGDPSWSTSAAFFDYDRDGWLDLFVCNYVQWTIETDIPCTVDHRHPSYCTPSVYPGQSCRLYHNRGNGTFEDVTAQSGICNPNGKSLGVTLLDYDDDGWLDLAVANDTEPNFLYHNNGDGTFTDEAILMGVAFDESGSARGGMGIDAADVHNDGGLAISIGNFSNEMTAFFYARPGDYFSDLATPAKIGNASLLTLTFGLFFFDFDLDGYLDLFCVNGHIEPDVGRYQQNVSYTQLPSLFWNRRDGTFEEIASQVGLGKPGVGRGAAYGDYDNDGDVDVLVSNNGVDAAYGKAWFLPNDGGNRNNYLRVKTIGVQSNQDGIGAKVIVKAGGVTQRRMVRTGSSYCSQSETTLTFGLGQSKRVESLEVIWPSGRIDRYADLLGNRLIEVVEGKTQNKD
ncbi:CRTAC1 family protein [Candidatus Poribacteria bacterium]|nr:CRTAC1 family protein [Candidatus Poribacteria bacterium]